jgi:two-component sensor histidine kinase/ABC-type uncharacterized transport system substrate-binding protein
MVAGWLILLLLTNLFFCCRFEFELYATLAQPAYRASEVQGGKLNEMSYVFLIDRAFRVRNLSVMWFFLLLFLVLSAPHIAEADDHQKKILVLHSYHHGLVWTDDIMEGIYSIFEIDDPDIEIYTEHMDTKRHFDGFDGKYLNSLLQVYRNKYGAMRFDAIISSDDNALRFLLMHHKDLFPGTPIIFCGVNDYTDALLSGHENITGVLEFLDKQASMDIALKLHPEAKEVFVITDTSTTGRANRLLMQGLATEYSDRAEFVFLDKDDSGLTQQELLDMLKELPGNSIVYYSDFLRSREGYIDQEKVVPMISKASSSPVYTHYDEILGLGVVGGKLVNGHSQGRKAAEIARKVIQGKPVSEIPVYKESINRYMFDYLQLERFGISGSDLPKNSVLINKADSFYETYKKRVWATAGIIGTLIILIVLLIINIARRRSAEEELKAAHGELEQKVEARTEELINANRLLQEEILERRNVEAEKALLYDSVPGYITVVDTNYRVLTYNRAVEEQFGKDLKDRLCYEVYQARDEICPDCAVKRCIESNKTEYTFQPATPVSKPVEIYAYPIFNEKGEVAAVVEHGIDISEKLEMIETIKKSEEQLKTSLKEKEILLKEIHHRVKNNMAIVSSLLQLQSQYVRDEKLNRIFKESRNRIASMALVHEKLYQSKDFIDINLKEYIQTLVDNLFSSYQTSKDAVRLKTDIDNIQLDIDKLIPCGLILNELITNSLKHAFQGRVDGEIRINFKSTGSDKVTFSVSDNGCGLPEDLDFSNPKTLGLNLVTSLTRQLKGDLRYDGKEGMSVEITFDY